MASKKQIHIIVGKLVISQVISKGHDDVLHGNVASSTSIKDLERIEEVEVWFEGHFDFGAFQFSFEEYVLFQDFCKLWLLNPVIITKSGVPRQDLRLEPRRVASTWRAASQGARGGTTNPDILLLGRQSIVTSRHVGVTTSSWTLVSEWWLPTASHFLQISHSAV